MDSKTIQSYANKIKENIESVLVGKSDTVDLVLTSLFAGGHVLLEDVPGTGKTMLAKTLAKSLDTKFARIQFTPDLLPSDITGLHYFNQKMGEFQFRQGPVFTNILLADEINRATPRTQSSMLECMEEKQVTVDGETTPLRSPFFVIATQNPIETAGTFPLPEAQLDRFMMQVSLGFPTEEEEIMIMNRFLQDNPYNQIHPVCPENIILDIHESLKEVFIHPIVMEYIAKLVATTRTAPEVALGVSPRGTLALIHALRSYAAIKGLSYVTPDMVKVLAVPVLAHRLVLHNNFHRRENTTEVMNKILNSTPVPTEDFKNK